MAKKGRPFTYQDDADKPVTISLRLPKDLHTRLERYAREHRQPLSELVRDGIEWRLGDGDPRGLGGASIVSSPRDNEVYYDNTEHDSTLVLQDIRQVLTRQEAQIAALTQALERQATRGAPVVCSSNTAMPVPGAVTPNGDNTVIQTEQTTQDPAAPPSPAAYRKALLVRVAELHQTMSLEDIAVQLNTEGIETFSGKGKWSRGTLAKLLKKTIVQV